MSESRATPLAVSVHDDGDDPYCGDTATHISVLDEGGGPFIEIRQTLTGQAIRLNFGEIDAVAAAANRLAAEYRKGQP